MGWAYCGKDGFGRQIGYGIDATCDKRGCNAVINRGLACVCGDMHHDLYDDEPGCGFYFCDDHLGWVGPRGGCQHRQKEPHGRTFCQLMGYGETVVGTSIPIVYAYGHFECACGSWEYRGDTTGMTLEKWRDVPGYAKHVGNSTMVTDMMASGEAPLPVECGVEWGSAASG